jgi:2-phospho-L-lactate/phosphoenolpyruvate guanylyltransferase
MDANTDPLPRVIAVVPVGRLEGAKSRLGGTLDAEERRDLVLRLLDRTLAATLALPEIADTIVVTPDDEVRGHALASGARPIRQRGEGLNAGLRQARDEALAAGATALLIVPIDLPRISPERLRDVLSTLADRHRPLVALVPDRHRRGTNALLVAPPDAIEPRFGGESRAAHEAAAGAAGARYVELDGPLNIDLDTPEDLLLAESLAAETADAV